MPLGLNSIPLNEKFVELIENQVPPHELSSKSLQNDQAVGKNIYEFKKIQSSRLLPDFRKTIQTNFS